MTEAIGRLPTFLVIGAMKAGTTSLYHYIRAHPQVFMPGIKAPEFFVAESNWNRGIGWYRHLFVPAGDRAFAVGEASNAYAKYPEYPGVPERMASFVPDVKLVYAVRDPIERIWSHYRTRAREGSEKAPIERAVFDNPIYLDYSRYALQLDRYLEYFPREQILVITAEELRDARRDTIRRVYGFIGVDTDFIPAELDREFYRTDDQPARSLVPLWIRKGLKRHVPAAKRAKELENNVFRTLRQLRARRRENGAQLARSDGSQADAGVGGASKHAVGTIPKHVRERIVEELAEDRIRLGALLGPDFHGWDVG
jgi:Sulfotransferase domain